MQPVADWHRNISAGPSTFKVSGQFNNKQNVNMKTNKMLGSVLGEITGLCLCCATVHAQPGGGGGPGGGGPGGGGFGGGFGGGGPGGGGGFGGGGPGGGGGFGGGGPGGGGFGGGGN